MLTRLLLFLSCTAGDSTPPALPSLVPQPAATRMLPGPPFDATAGAVVVLSDSTDTELRRLGLLAAGILSQGSPPRTESRRRTNPLPVVRLVLDSGATLPPEGYRLEAGANVLSVTGSPAGIFYGLQTLRQLLPPGGSGRVPSVRIEDAPRFPYRGMHLDVSRHLFPVAFLERYIDLLARYKLNTFHWHLTDDQGWRIAIKKYPRLTSVGAWRRETVLNKQMDPFQGDGEPYGGFYTQADIRRIVAYAKERFVTVIPEIELPGHAVAALAAYPELACTPGPFAVGTTWGVYDDIYCPSERTFTFLEDVLTEVMDLFPSRYIHVGGDEVPKTRWKASPVAQEVIRREGLRDEAELQSYFVRRIEAFLIAHGRRLIGWDEILEGGLAPEATVMSWRGVAGGIAAAQQGHDVIMTPGSHLYFDHYQGPPETEPLAIGGFTPVERVYGFEPVPPTLSEAEAQHVLGAQGNVWTEYITSPTQVEYMVFPRMLALAEVTWTPAEHRDSADFLRRLPAQLEQLDRWGVNYRIPDVTGLEEDRLVLGDSATVTLGSPLPRGRVLYAIDGGAEDDTGIYADPLHVALGDSGVRVTARLVLANGRLGPVRHAWFRRATLQPAAAVDRAALVPGLTYSYHEARLRRATQVPSFAPVRRGGATGIALTGEERPEQFGVRFAGYLLVPADGVYAFALSADDGGVLHIGGETVVDNDGPHGMLERRGMVALAAGLHPFELLYFQGGGDRGLELRMLRDGVWGPIPAEWLYRRP
jgi:hexosaminidase